MQCWVGSGGRQAGRQAGETNPPSLCVKCTDLCMKRRCIKSSLMQRLWCYPLAAPLGVVGVPCHMTMMMILELQKAQQQKKDLSHSDTHEVILLERCTPRVRSSRGALSLTLYGMVQAQAMAPGGLLGTVPYHRLVGDIAPLSSRLMEP